MSTAEFISAPMEWVILPREKKTLRKIHFPLDHDPAGACGAGVRLCGRQTAAAHLSHQYRTAGGRCTQQAGLSGARSRSVLLPGEHRLGRAGIPGRGLLLYQSHRGHRPQRQPVRPELGNGAVGADLCGRIPLFPVRGQRQGAGGKLHPDRPGDGKHPAAGDRRGTL